MSNTTNAHVQLLVAESEFLKAGGWVPLAPYRPGGDVLWRLGDNGAELTQDAAVAVQKSIARE